MQNTKPQQQPHFHKNLNLDSKIHNFQKPCKINKEVLRFMKLKKNFFKSHSPYKKISQNKVLQLNELTVYEINEKHQDVKVKKNPSLKSFKRSVQPSPRKIFEMKKFLNINNNLVKSMVGSPKQYFQKKLRLKNQNKKKKINLSRFKKSRLHHINQQQKPIKVKQFFKTPSAVSFKYLKENAGVRQDKSCYQSNQSIQLFQIKQFFDKSGNRAKSVPHQQRQTHTGISSSKNRNSSRQITNTSIGVSSQSIFNHLTTQTVQESKHYLPLKNKNPNIQSQFLFSNGQTTTKSVQEKLEESCNNQLKALIKRVQQKQKKKTRDENVEIMLKKQRKSMNQNKMNTPVKKIITTKLDTYIQDNERIIDQFNEEYYSRTQKNSENFLLKSFNQQQTTPQKKHIIEGFSQKRTSPYISPQLKQKIRSFTEAQNTPIKFSGKNLKITSFFNSDVSSNSDEQFSLDNKNKLLEKIQNFAGFLLISEDCVNFLKQITEFLYDLNLDEEHGQRFEKILLEFMEKNVQSQENEIEKLKEKCTEQEQLISSLKTDFLQNLEKEFDHSSKPSIDGSISVQQFQIMNVLQLQISLMPFQQQTEEIDKLNEQLQSKDTLIEKLQRQLQESQSQESLNSTTHKINTEPMNKSKNVNYKKLYEYKVKENKLLAQEMISLRTELSSVNIIQPGFHRLDSTFSSNRQSVERKSNRQKYQRTPTPNKSNKESLFSVASSPILIKRYNEMKSTYLSNLSEEEKSELDLRDI